MVKTVCSDGTPSKAIPPLLNVHVYFAKACRCRVAIPQASKLAKTVASDGTPLKQPSSFRHVTSLDGRPWQARKRKLPHTFPDRSCVSCATLQAFGCGLYT